MTEKKANTVRKDMNDETTLTHEAERDLRNDVRRDAAEERERSSDRGVSYGREAEETEASMDVTRHHDAR
jgi:hypothetical protein